MVDMGTRDHATRYQYHCISDRFDTTLEPFDSVGDFIAMCEACFDESPELVAYDGIWYDADGQPVLETREVAA